MFEFLLEKMAESKFFSKKNWFSKFFLEEWENPSSFRKKLGFQVFFNRY